MVSFEEACRKAAEALVDQGPMVVVTGAGISVDSGIPPFRGPGGLWSRYDAEVYGHVDTFRKRPELSWKMLDDIIGTAIGARPNEAHLSLARMEGKGLVGLVATQNVDGLHGLAGSVEVVELHGNARRIFCPACGEREELSPGSYPTFNRRCSCGAFKRPDIVFFGEELPERALRKALAAAGSGAPMLIVGTSGVVHPASMLPYVAKTSGSTIVEVNPQPSELTGLLTGHFIGERASLAVPALEKAILDIIGSGHGQIIL